MENFLLILFGLILASIAIVLFVYRPVPKGIQYTFLRTGSGWSVMQRSSPTGTWRELRVYETEREARIACNNLRAGEDTDG